jgi:hypothetical protein
MLHYLVSPPSLPPSIPTHEPEKRSATGYIRKQFEKIVQFGATIVALELVEACIQFDLQCKLQFHYTQEMNECSILTIGQQMCTKCFQSSTL